MKKTSGGSRSKNSNPERQACAHMCRGRWMQLVTLAVRFLRISPCASFRHRLAQRDEHMSSRATVKTKPIAERVMRMPTGLKAKRKRNSTENDAENLMIAPTMMIAHPAPTTMRVGKQLLQNACSVIVHTMAIHM